MCLLLFVCCSFVCLFVVHCSSEKIGDDTSWGYVDWGENWGENSSQINTGYFF